MWGYVGEAAMGVVSIRFSRLRLWIMGWECGDGAEMGRRADIVSVYCGWLEQLSCSD